MPLNRVLQEMQGLVLEGTFLDGVAVVVDMQFKPLPCTIWTVPVAGDSITISYSLDGGVTYTVWPNGIVTAKSSDILLSGITHLKFQRTAGAGVTSTYGVC